MNGWQPGAVGACAACSHTTQRKSTTEPQDQDQLLKRAGMGFKLAVGLVDLAHSDTVIWTHENLFCRLHWQNKHMYMSQFADGLHAKEPHDEWLQDNRCVKPGKPRSLTAHVCDGLQFSVLCRVAWSYIPRGSHLVSIV